MFRPSSSDNKKHCGNFAGTFDLLNINILEKEFTASAVAHYPDGRFPPNTTAAALVAMLAVFAVSLPAADGRYTPEHYR